MKRRNGDTDHCLIELSLYVPRSSTTGPQNLGVSIALIRTIFGPSYNVLGVR